MSNVLFGLFCLALLVTFVTDFLYLIIHRAATLLLIPFFLLASTYGLTPVTFSESLFGICIGYGFLWLFNALYARFRQRDGIGQGDFELLATIGSYLGIEGVLFSMTLGSCIGSLFAILLLVLKRADAQTALPFGSFLVLGCFVYMTLIYLHLIS